LDLPKAEIPHSCGQMIARGRPLRQRLLEAA
jgi:hypothetical protein